MKKLFLIDAYALIFKYYYAFYGRPMRNRAGMNTSIVFGFTKFLRDIVKREKPDLLGVAFDPAGGSFRREMFPEYKANRPETPEDIIESVPYVKRIVEAMCIPILEVEGYEADDVIGTLAFKGSNAGYEVYMVTPDKDYGQLVGTNRKIYKQKGDQIEIIDSQAIKDKYGIDDPMLVSDILALWGDASDNIPGVAGIGEKGARKLVQKWGDVENIIANTDAIGGKRQAPTYAYMFMWRSPISKGSVHGNELNFCFNTLSLGERELPVVTEADQRLADVMSRSWAQFAHTGDPNVEGLPAWQPYTAENGELMFLDHACYTRSHHDRALQEIIDRHCFKQLDEFRKKQTMNE